MQNTMTLHYTYFALLYQLMLITPYFFKGHHLRLNETFHNKMILTVSLLFHPMYRFCGEFRCLGHGPVCPPPLNLPVSSTRSHIAAPTRYSRADRRCRHSNHRVIWRARPARCGRRHFYRQTGGGGRPRTRSRSLQRAFT